MIQLMVNLRTLQSKIKELKKSVWLAHATYQAQLKAEKLEDERKREEAEQKNQA